MCMHYIIHTRMLDLIAVVGVMCDGGGGRLRYVYQINIYNNIIENDRRRRGRHNRRMRYVRRRPTAVRVLKKKTSFVRVLNLTRQLAP